MWTHVYNNETFENFEMNTIKTENHYALLKIFGYNLKNVVDWYK